MKKLVFLGLAFVVTGCATTSSQEPREPLNQVTEIIDLQGMPKNEIFEKSKIWIAKSFNSANNVIQYADKETGSIIGKGNIQYPCSGYMDCAAFGDNIINFTVKIDVKENKTRIMFNDLTRKSNAKVTSGIVIPGGEGPILIPNQKQQVENKLKQVIESYKKDIMNQQADSNW